MELDVVNKLYLELSQVATAKTQREIDLERTLATEREICAAIQVSLANLATYAANPTAENWALPMSGQCIAVRDSIRSRITY